VKAATGTAVATVPLLVSAMALWMPMISALPPSSSSSGAPETP